MHTPTATVHTHTDGYSHTCTHRDTLRAHTRAHTHAYTETHCTHTRSQMLTHMLPMPLCEERSSGKSPRPPQEAEPHSKSRSPAALPGVRAQAGVSLPARTAAPGGTGRADGWLTAPTLAQESAAVPREAAQHTGANSVLSRCGSQPVPNKPKTTPTHAREQ